MRAVLALALAAVLGCSHETRPAVQPDDHPPLPPASGTPIGYLIDDAGELALRDDQLTHLKEIDSELADKLAVLDGGQRGSKPAGDATASQSGRRRGGRRGGMGGAGMGGAGGGMGGGGTGRGGRGRRSAQGAGAGPGSATASSGGGAAASVNERAADVHDALRRAFAVLDPHQKEIATRVLSDHGVDVDTDHPGEDAEEPAAGSDGK